ncbi:hypothetical protein PC129_g2606 [Phytophthora cactorum]|uniref:Uncharacterized protein n=1 Tax=Phytophthora cactorum TaxID=29920 RepID=A0A8T1DB84_9STRA|nr:hypothetical protein PC112_g4165 [Phytophthora cactorum]KAG2841317.1 hypothetical protein PC111_g3108 [Phytophthora cactorum]KAG2924264.1 hypothetical protein PC114_g4533 [Phytophthora cactorum]KAG2938025.1 hypothetical protein PC115_g3882 [Phytophthora cactorum]KAG2954969.1 hypothetical protein PC117_g820 [Phytophthora cactorum]
MDRDLACINAITRVFPFALSLMCQWYMDRNVLSKTHRILDQVAVDQPAPGQDTFENSCETDSSMPTYYEAVNAGTEVDFEAA